jgi:hypothetical protein
MRAERYAPARGAATLVVAAALAFATAACSGGDEPTATPQPPATVTPPPPTLAPPATSANRTQRVYEAYYRHCRRFTWPALVYPQAARSETEAARKFAGPPRPYQRPAFRGCLAGLRAGEATIDLAEVKRLVEAEEAEHGD